MRVVVRGVRVCVCVRVRVCVCVCVCVCICNTHASTSSERDTRAYVRTNRASFGSENIFLLTILIDLVIILSIEVAYVATVRLVRLISRSRDVETPPPTTPPLPPPPSLVMELEGVLAVGNMRLILKSLCTLS